MSPSGNLDWVWYGAGVVFALHGLALAYWSLLHDRARGRRRCPKCWYDMSSPGPDPLTCPECGRTAKREKKLFKTRRRWGLVFVSLSCFLISAGLGLTPKVKRDGFWSLVSNSNLVLLLPLAQDAQGYIGIEMNRRLSGFLLTDDELEQFFERCAKGDLFARPISEDWKDKYGKLIKDTEFNLNTLAVLRSPVDQVIILNHALARIPMEFELRTRPVWPKGVPLYIEAQMRNWWPYRWGHQVFITPPGPDAEDIRMFGETYGFEAPWIDSDASQVVIDYRIIQIHMENNEQILDTYEEGSCTLPVTFSGTIDDLLTPIRSEEMDTYFTDALKYEHLRNKSGRGGTISFNIWDMRDEMFLDLAIGVRLEFIYDGEVVVWKPMWWTISRKPDGYLSFVGNNLSPIQGDIERYSAATSAEGWTLRMRSDPEIALRVMDAETYWEGEVTIPLVIGVR